MLFSLIAYNVSDVFICRQFVDDAISLLNFLREEEAKRNIQKMQSMATVIMLPHIKDEDRKRIMQTLFKEEKKPLTAQQERDALLKLKSMLQ